MNKPPLEELLLKVDSRYTLAVAAAQRARAIMNESHGDEDYQGDKPVTRALKERCEGKVVYKKVSLSDNKVLEDEI